MAGLIYGYARVGKAPNHGSGGQDSTVLYRHDIAQGQMAGYLNTDGNQIPDANSTALDVLFLGKKVFERPAALPEDIGY